MAKKFVLEHTPVPIYGYGDKNAPILVVCDSPGVDVYSRGEMMSGSALSLFIKEAKGAGLSQSDFSFVIPTGPVPSVAMGSDARETQFLAFYEQAFDELVSQYSPRIVVYLGKSAGRQFTRKAIKITKVRGKVFEREGKPPYMGIFSPLHVLRRPDIREVFHVDMRKLGAIAQAGWDHRKANDDMSDGHGYRWVKDLQFLIDNPPKSLFVDTEFRNLRWYSADHLTLVGQLCWGSSDDGHYEAVAFPLSGEYAYRHGMGYSGRGIAKLKGQLKTLMENPSIAKAGFNLKIDIHTLNNMGIEVRNWYVDTQMLAFAMDENMLEKSQSECVRRWTPEMAGYSDIFDANTDKERMMDVPPDPMLKYGCGDVDSGYRLTKTLAGEVRKDPRQWKILMKVQMPALRCFQQMERRGLLINEPALDELQVTLERREEVEYAELIAQVPAPIRRRHLEQANQRGKDVKDVLSFSRDDFTRDILFTPEGLGLTPRVFTKSTRTLADQYKIPSASSKEHLPYFSDDEPFVASLIKYKKLQKMVSTYVGRRHDPDKDGPTGFFQYLLASQDGNIHPSFLLHRTVTGRTASADPNSQNFPKRGELAKAFRRLFQAPTGWKIIECDLSQAELRIAAWMAMEPTMLRIYQSGGDIHAATAAVTMGKSMAEFVVARADKHTLLLDVYRDWAGSENYIRGFSREKRAGLKLCDFLDFKRYQAKAINFGFLYGMGWRKFQGYAKTDYGITFTEVEAQETRNVFFATYSGLPEWHAAMREFVRRHGYVRALHGAIRHLPNIDSIDDAIRGECERQAINSPVQRFGSDLGLIGMTRYGRDVNWNNAYPAAFIHDSVVAFAKDEHAEETAKALKWYMQTPPLEEWFGIRSPLPIVADLAIGTNLGEMEEVNWEASCPEWYRGDEDKVFEQPILAD